MVDVFTVDQGKRMFAFIGIGGTLGAIVGGWATTVISGMTTSVYLSPGLMLVGAAFFAVSIWTMLKLDRRAVASEHSRLTASSGPTRDAAGQQHEAPRIGGSYLDGIRAVATSPYLLGIALYIVFLAIGNTLLYFTQAVLVSEAADSFSQRVASFAQLDMIAQIATLITQMFITTQLIKRVGVGWTLSVLPLVTLAGFSVLAVWPLFGVFAIFNALQRATRYAVSRPARETLFSVVPPADKYKAKPLIDVFLYRGGDVAGAAIDGAIRAAGLSFAGVAAATVPFAGIWCLLCLALGRTQQRLDSEQPPNEVDPGADPRAPVASATSASH
jgi:AAA family ATP:ADP antiporter